MNTNNPETGPKPLSREYVLEHSILAYGALSVVNEGRFSRYGIFSVISGNDPSIRLWDLELTADGEIPYNIGLVLWSSKLLDLDPERYILRWLNNRKSFIARDQVTGKLTGIPLASVRGIKNGNVVSEVGNSGYLIGMYPGTYGTEEARRHLDAELAGIENGIAPAPRGRNESPYVKVLEPEYIGREVLLLRFGENYIFDDGVVIDMDTKKLLRRSFEKPFSDSRWGGNLNRFEIPTKTPSKSILDK